MGRDFNVPNPEGLESVSNWTNLGINSQQASATMKKYNLVPVIGHPDR